jgi:hypothetical protein
MATIATSTTPTRYTLTFYVRQSDLDKALFACFESGAGTYPVGRYSNVCFISEGRRQFRWTLYDRPHYEQETRVEMICVGKEVMEKAVQELKQQLQWANPNVVVPYQVFKMEDI